MKTTGSSRLSKVVSLLFVAFGLAACGGGSGDGGAASSTVPTAGTVALATDVQEAKDLVVLAVGADDSVTNTQENFKRAAPLGNRTGGAVAVKSMNAVLGRKLISESTPCSEIFPASSSLGQFIVTGCAGLVLITSNFDNYNSNQPFPAGAYVRTVFQNMTVTLNSGQTISIGGTVTLTVLSTLDTALSGLVGSYRISAAGLSGVDENGVTFGPENFTMDITTQANGSTSIVYDGVRVDNIQVVETTDPETYRINSGSIVIGYDGGYADIEFQNWDVVGGVPQPGSMISISGVNGSGSITVTSVTATTITFGVVINAGGISETHTVLASVSNGQVTVI